MKELCQLQFYQHPVELEEVESGEFLGTILHPSETLNSAGSDSHKTAAVNSRICLASRCSTKRLQSTAGSVLRHVALFLSLKETGMCTRLVANI